MDKAMLRWMLVLLLGHASVGHALDSNTERAIRAATFEFWAPGNSAEGKGLAGSAFAIGPNEFVTAAHLFDKAIGSRFGPPVLTDSGHTQYAIADILQFSEQQDYAIFSLQHPPRLKPLAIRSAEQTESDLYLAGSHPSGKIVIEHGTFCGLTRDSESGQFDWLRFSGPIWGGLGGGPLLDASGRVTGIVQAQARNGGANYALPIHLVRDGAVEPAHIHAMEMLRTLMPAVSTVAPLEAEIPLPLSFEKFAHELEQQRLAYFDREIGPLLEATRRNFVLTGSGAADVCSLLNGSNCACKPSAGSSGVLVVDESTASELIRNPDNGMDIVAKVAGVVVVRTRGPGAATYVVGANAGRERDLTNDPRLHLELALKTPATADSPVPIPAKGTYRPRADQDRVYIDFRERAWRVRSWPLPDQDLEVISLARKLAAGHVILTRIVPAALSHAAELQLEFVANLVYYECEQLQGEGVARLASTTRLRTAQKFAFPSGG